MIRSNPHTQQIHPPAGQVVFKEKLSFEEWWATKGQELLDDEPPITAYYIASNAWKAALTNK